MTRPTRIMGARVLVGGAALWFIGESLWHLAVGPFVAIEDVGPFGAAIAAAVGLAVACFVPKRRLVKLALISVLGALVLSPLALYLMIGDIPPRLAGRVGGSGLGYATLYVVLFLAIFSPLERITQVRLAVASVD